MEDLPVNFNEVAKHNLFTMNAFLEEMKEGDDNIKQEPAENKMLLWKYTTLQNDFLSNGQESSLKA